MKAVVVEKFGGPGVLHVADRGLPEPGAGLARQAADGRLRLTVARTYPLEEAPAAHATVDTGHGRGKTVLLVD